MKIYEVTFKDSPTSKAEKRRYFSSYTEVKGFTMSHINSLFIFKIEKHEVGRNKSDIIKFLNKENGDD